MRPVDKDELDTLCRAVQRTMRMFGAQTDTDFSAVARDGGELCVLVLRGEHAFRHLELLANAATLLQAGYDIVLPLDVPLTPGNSDRNYEMREDIGDDHPN